MAYLGVHVSGGGVERRIAVTDLSFAKSARGGYMSADFDLAQWVDSMDPALAPVSRVMVDDPRTGGRVWEGNLELSGRTVDDAGHTWKVGAVGSAAVLADAHKAYVAVDSGFDGWKQSFASNGALTASAAASPSDEDVDALVFTFGNGAVGANSRVSMRYSRFAEAGQKVGGFDWAHIEGFGPSTVQQMQVVTGISPSNAVLDTDGQDFSQTLTDSAPRSAGGTVLTGVNRDLLTLRMIRLSGATNVGSDVWWGSVTQMVVQALRRDQAGATVSGSGTYDTPYVLAHQGIVDALWHFTNQIDIANASIDTTWTYQCDQMAYPDGVRLPDVLEDWALLEPDLIWQVGASNAAGKHSFALRRWPTTVRYEADTSDGWSQPGGEADLANTLRVYYTDRRGNQRSVLCVSGAVAQLDQWGRTRDAESVDLGSEVGTAAAALAVGNAILAQAGTVPFAGTLTVARPIRDLLLGRMVEPHEIEPGYLAVVRDVAGPPMRLEEMSYRDSGRSASLTLGTPVYSTDEFVASQARRRVRRRR